MNIILLQDIDKVGEKYEVVTVKDGFARNLLIPTKKAVIANQANLAKLDELKQKHATELATQIGEFQAIADKIKEITLRIGAKAGTSGKIFGSVTNTSIAQALKEQCEVEVIRSKVEILDDVKELGTYKANVRLHPEVLAEVAFEVVAE
ncbi:MAG: 50S ribosomal protein L9 [Saprospiraceae bacterium]|nr:50S ribosomal protein L9 [Saprospiraceae bacterium]